ncbi:MAG TPA: hypothetical protein VNI01_02970 [Elusimicrobiota bacterium]|jgi:hypothetical protein|nr:hypothetical protein [Elusimicrobiota bacterium]
MARLALGVVVLVLLCLAAALVASAWAAAEVRGGGARIRAPRRPSGHLVVDTLNLVHWLRARKAAPDGSPGGDANPGAPLTPTDIAAAVDATAAALKKKYPGRVIYVLKDRESRFNDESLREVYQAAAQRNQVTVALVERYQDPPAGAPASADHSARGRDDFYMSVLAQRLGCAVLTADRLRDFAAFRATVAPFQVLEFAYWRRFPSRDYVRPASPAFARLRRPATIHPAEVLGAE